MSTKKIFYFFSISDFSYTDGGTVRMKGIIEALIDKGYSVTLISNAKFRDEFPRNVKHIFINRKLTKNERRKIQLMTAILPFMFVKILLKNLLNHFDQIISGNLLFDKKIIFFEYFDCALAYLFKKRGIINAYVNDIHGIAPLEFWCKKPATMLGVFVKYPKYFVSELLDYKIYKLGDGIIVINQIVKD